MVKVILGCFAGISFLRGGRSQPYEKQFHPTWDQQQKTGLTVKFLLYLNSQRRGSLGEKQQKEQRGRRIQMRI